MSYLAGNLLLYQDPFQAFVSFANMLNSPFFHVRPALAAVGVLTVCSQAFLKLESGRMTSRYAVFDQLFSEYLPDLHRCVRTRHSAARAPHRPCLRVQQVRVRGVGATVLLHGVVHDPLHQAPRAG
jgi:hypothetical protein